MELREIIEMAKSSGFNSIGLRADDKVLNAGDSLEKSHDWDFENDCSSDELLSGTCALSGNFWFLDGFDDAESQREDEHTLQSLIKESKVYKRMHLYLIHNIAFRIISFQKSDGMTKLNLKTQTQ